jgi:hypothetical protein
MHMYPSGVPRCDVYQPLENRLCTHRLFSMYAEGRPAAVKWFRLVRAGIFSVADYVEAYKPKNAAFRERAERSWRTLEENDSPILRADPYPRHIMIDSGAFSAWNKRCEVTLEEVQDAYREIIAEAGDRHELWFVNLDKIPGEPGRDPTADEIKRAIEKSDRNYEALTAEFGERILPVFHQSEDDARLHEVVAMAREGYICVSPRNDVLEAERIQWARRVHRLLGPDVRTHGLATTGSGMVTRVRLYSGDSAAWVSHALNGKVDVAFPWNGGHQYESYFVTDDPRVQAGRAHYKNAIGETAGSRVPETIARYGFTIEDAAEDFRVRCMINMGELTRFAAAVRERWAV